MLVISLILIVSGCNNTYQEDYDMPETQYQIMIDCHLNNK